MISMPSRRMKLVIVAASAVSVVALVYTKSQEWRELASDFCGSLSEDPEIGPDLSRDAFASNIVDPVEGIPGHTHANAAALRTGATRFAMKMARYIGAQLYVVQMSKSDQRKGLKGTRQWFWAKDVNASNRRDQPSPDDIRYICDVDYYLDMPKLLADEAKPVLLYTVVPETATSTGEDDTYFHFESDGSLTTKVAGGGSYQHHLWDYGADSFLVSRKFFGVPYHLTAYAVERKQVGKHRQLVLLAPIKQFKWIAAALAGLLLQTKRLERFNPIVHTEGGPYVRYNVLAPDGQMLVTTSKAGTGLSATIPCQTDEAVATMVRLSTNKLLMPTTASWVEDRYAAAVLTDYHRLVGPKPVPTVYPVAQGVRAYQYRPDKFDQEARPKLEAFMSPIIHGAFAPVPNKDGEEAAVEGRVNRLKAPEPKPNAFVEQCAEEFAELIMNGMTLEPYSYETVSEKQRTPAQRQSFDRGALMGMIRKSILKCFIKSESYPDVKDPRIISTFNDGYKMDMSTFSLPLSEHCKQFEWYGPGKTPEEIANRVALICRTALEYVNLIDFHRMDGTIKYLIRRLVDRTISMKAFTNHRAVLNELLKKSADNKGVFQNGTTFQQGPAQGSGGPDTSNFGTLRSGFTSYLGFRHTVNPRTGRKYSPHEAFGALGLHLGDDGIDADLPDSSAQWASKATGLIIESDIVHRGSRGVNFLARYYSPYVWQGLPDSMCDVRRQLVKFHTTVRLPFGITPEQKLVEKAMSFVATDRNTPVIGPLCQKVLLLSQYRPQTPLGIGSWWSKFDESVQYPNENVDGWMDAEFDHVLPGFDRDQFESWLSSTQSAEELLSPPLCHEIVPATPTRVSVVVDGQVLPASTSCGRKQATEPLNPEKRKRRRGRKPSIKSTSPRSNQS